MSKELIGVSQQAFPIEDLIIGPIQAIIEAQSISKQRSVEFLEEVGFEAQDTRKGKSEPKLRTVEFSYEHPIPDPQNPGQVIDTPTKVKFPLLSIVPTPNIDISEATVDFNIKVVGFSKKNTKSTLTKKSPFSIRSVYASRAKPTNESEQEPHTISVSIKLKKGETSETERKVNNLLSDAIITHPLERGKK